MSSAGPLVAVNLLTADECRAVLDTLSDTRWRIAHSGGYREGHMSAHQTQLPAVAATDWVFERMFGALHHANRKIGFEVAHCKASDLRGDSCIFRYREGDFFGWHTDDMSGDGGERKLSIIVQLSDPASYEGGDLEFLPGGTLAVTRLQGTGIVFAAHRCHRVTQVQRGMRHSLAGGLFGPPLR
jgi:PKHD-type hydroxylase